MALRVRRHGVQVRGVGDPRLDAGPGVLVAWLVLGLTGGDVRDHRGGNVGCEEGGGGGKGQVRGEKFAVDCARAAGDVEDGGGGGEGGRGVDEFKLVAGGRHGGGFGWVCVGGPGAGHAVGVVLPGVAGDWGVRYALVKS